MEDDDADVGEVLDNIDRDFLEPPNQKAQFTGRKSIAVNRLAPMGDLPLDQKAWRSRPTSVPYTADIFPESEEEEDDDYAPPSEGSRKRSRDPSPMPSPMDSPMASSPRRFSAPPRSRYRRNDVDSDSEDAQIVSGPPDTQEGPEAVDEASDRAEDAGWVCWEDNQDFGQQSPVGADEEEQEVGLPKHVEEWAVTRFFYNGGDRMNKNALRRTLKEVWESFQAPRPRDDGPTSHQRRQKDAQPEVDFCWMCMTGLGEYDRILSTHMSELNALFEKYVLVMPPEQLGAVLFQYYEDHVYLPMLNNSLNPAPWSLDMAREHLVAHVDDVRIKLMQKQKRIDDALEEMYTNLFEVSEIDPTRSQHRPEVWRDILSGEAMWLKMRSAKPQNMIGFNQSLKIDTNQTASLVRYANLKVTEKKRH